MLTIYGRIWTTFKFPLSLEQRSKSNRPHFLLNQSLSPENLDVSIILTKHVCLWYIKYNVYKLLSERKVTSFLFTGTLVRELHHLYQIDHIYNHKTIHRFPNMFKFNYMALAMFGGWATVKLPFSRNTI